MSLYTRLAGFDDAGTRLPSTQRINQHGFEIFLAVLCERARGVISTNAAGRDILNAALAARGKDVMSAEDESDAVALLTSINGQANATAKLLRAMEISDVLRLAGERATGYTTSALVKTRLGL